MISDDGYVLRSINRHGHFGRNLSPASISTILKALQKDLEMDSDEQPLSSYSFRVGAAIDLLEKGEPLERIMLRGDGRQIQLPCHTFEVGLYNLKKYNTLS